MDSDDIGNNAGTFPAFSNDGQIDVDNGVYDSCTQMQGKEDEFLNLL